MAGKSWRRASGYSSMRSAIVVALLGAIANQSIALVPVAPSVTSSRWPRASPDLQSDAAGDGQGRADRKWESLSAWTPCSTVSLGGDSRCHCKSVSRMAEEDLGARAFQDRVLLKRTSRKTSRIASTSSGYDERGEDSSCNVVVSQGDDKAPVDWILSRRLPSMSRRYYRKALEEGRVQIDGRTVKRCVRVGRGSTISVAGLSGTGERDDVAARRNLLFPQDLPGLRVLYEDKHCAVISKPAGMVCQPCEAARSGTVLHGLLHHMVHTKQVEEGDLTAATTLSQGIVQRLDKNTSGVMVVAKSLDASSKFSKMFKNAKVRKEYVAICHGDPGFDSVIDAPLYRRSSGKVGAVSKSQAAAHRAKNAQTRVRNVATAARLSVCRAEIITGRMHQVRVHLKWQGCPILGDREYGDSEADNRVSRRGSFPIDPPGRPLLHSSTLEFTHPFTRESMRVRAPMPWDMWDIAEKILRASGTPEQRQEFEELQELESGPSRQAEAPRVARSSRTKRAGKGGVGAREAYVAVFAAGIEDRR